MEWALSATTDIFEGFRIGRSYFWPGGAILVALLLLYRPIVKFLSEAEFFKGGGIEVGKYPPTQPPPTEEEPPPGGKPPPRGEPAPAQLTYGVGETTGESADEIVGEPADTVARQWAEAVNWYAWNWHYERTYRLIFGTQINLLFASRGLGGTLPKLEAHKYYTQHLGLVGGGYSYPLDAYFGFLTTMQLMTDSAETLVLTNAGEGFLEWLEREQPPAKPY